MPQEVLGAVSLCLGPARNHRRRTNDLERTEERTTQSSQSLGTFYLEISQQNTLNENPDSTEAHSDTPPKSLIKNKEIMIIKRIIEGLVIIVIVFSLTPPTRKVWIKRGRLLHSGIFLNLVQSSELSETA